MQKSKRIHSYDFFQGVLSTGLIFVMTFLEFSGPGTAVEIFYRWASIGFLFFSGLLIGEIFLKKKNSIFFIKRGIQVFSLFLVLNIFSFLSHFSFDEWRNFSVLLIRGDYSLVAHLLLPLSAVFFLTPFLRYIPVFLGFFWALLGFFLIDLLSLEKGVFFLNIFYLFSAVLGVFTGRLFSLNRLRVFFHKKNIILPYLFLYIAFEILAMGYIFSDSFFSLFSLFWSFHFLIMILLYLSLPSLLFSGEKRKPALRKFFETLGVEMLFVYVFASFVLNVLSFFVSGLTGMNPLILAVHLIVLVFGIVFILQKNFRKYSKTSRMKKIFRFLF